MSSNTVACKRCGALNGSDFERCIRCNRALGGAEPADKAARRIPAPRRAGYAALEVGPGAEPLWGRWEAEQLPAAKLLLALNMAIFAMQLFVAFQQDPSFGTLLMGGGDVAEYLRFGALPLLGDDPQQRGVALARLFAGAGLDPVVVRAEPWRLLTSCFAHAGVIHIGFNMFWLVQLARMVEPAVGSVRFAIAYLLAGIGGSAAMVGWWLLFPNTVFVVGASGSVFGLIGMVLGFLWRRRDPRWKDWLVRAVVYTLLITFLISSGGPIRVAHAAHIGGLISGAAFGALFAPGAPKPSLRWQRVACYLLVLACLASLVAVQLSPYVQAFER